jgi:hypothetical protein
MRALTLLIFLACSSVEQAVAWGQEGHSIIAEIAQRRLSPDAAAMVSSILGPGHSLASIASWADDVRDERPETYNWHFVNIPINVPNYKPERDCKDDKKAGDCIINELERLKTDLRCASGDRRLEALKFVVHFVGDIHQPLHTVEELNGGNDVKVEIFMRGLTCTGKCEPTHTPTNLHAAWDSGLIQKTVWDWGAYVDRLEREWLISDEAKKPGIEDGEPTQWAEETHKFAPMVWNSRPADNVLDDHYFQYALPIIDRQLGVAGLRLAHFLNKAASGSCH